MDTIKKILVVDDEKDVRDALRTVLEASHFKVIEASNGDEGLMLTETERPDLILLDIIMPHMNGHHVLRELRAHPWGMHMHVLLLTNADDPANISQGVGLRSDEYIIKAQTSLEEIVKKVKQHLAGYHD